MDVLLVEAAGPESAARMMAALGSMQVETITSWSAAIAILQARRPCAALAVLAVVNSTTEDLRALVAVAEHLARRKPLVVVDDDFNLHLGLQLLAVGVEDYLNARLVSTAELNQRVAWAVVRHAQRAEYEPLPPPGPVSLPARLQQVLNLLLDGHSTKQIARQLGSRPKTIYSQIASLRQHFGVRSNQELLIACLRDARRVPQGSPGSRKNSDCVSQESR